MRLGLMIGTALALAGCAADTGAGGDGDYMDDDLPMGNCSDGSGGACPEDSGNVPAGFPCGGTAECSGDLSCVAPFADDEVGEFTCSAQCIPTDDEAWWCIDPAGCCDPNATCTPRGLCVVPDAIDDTAGDDTIGASTGGSGSTGSGGSDSGTDSGSGASDSGSDGSAGDESSSSTGGA